MKLFLIAIILIIASACEPQLPKPIVINSEPPISLLTSSNTSAPACICPTGVVAPAQPQGRVIAFPPVICNCPAILVSPPAEVTEAESSSQNIPTSGITVAGNGKTLVLQPGESFLLNLGMDEFDWTVNIDNQNVLSRVKGVMVVRGAQGIYEANSLGQAVLTATGNPLCRKSVPACAMPSMLFRITVIVQ